MLTTFISDSQTFMALTVEDLAKFLLIDLGSFTHINLTNYCVSLENSKPLPDISVQLVKDRVSEAWSFLQRIGFLVTQPGVNPGFERISEEGRKTLASSPSISIFRTRLSKDFLHPVLLEKAYPNYLAGKWEEAVFQACKRLEIAVKQSCPDDFKRYTGVSLMNVAFRNSDNNSGPGPLTDPVIELAEQDGLRFLFAGAMSAIRNPAFHRDVVLDDRVTAQILMFVSYLLSLINK